MVQIANLVDRLTRRLRRNRYANLFRTIRDRRCRRIVEIGVWRGVHAERMIGAAAQAGGVQRVEYFGFDLFEDLTEEQYRLEFSKRPPTLSEVHARLSATGAAIKLFKGDTKETLPAQAAGIGVVDFIFVDGGHSFETIEADWRNVQPMIGPHTVVIFDDFYPGAMPPGQSVGCQNLIGRLAGSGYRTRILEPIDRFDYPWGTLEIQMAMVEFPVGAARQERQT